MPDAPFPALVERLRELAADPAIVTDGDLLNRFAREGDPVAFEALVWRHARLVMGVCRRRLRHHQDAEDAFQAVFLSLARNARRIRRGAALPAWLHTTAVRAARRARRRRRPVLLADVPDQPTSDPPAAAAEAAEARAVLDEEVRRLPARLRAAFVLCELEGRSHADAARELGVPKGTVDSRMAAAKHRLHKALARRGLTLGPALVLAAAVPEMAYSDAARRAAAFGLRPPAEASSAVAGLLAPAGGGRWLAGLAAVLAVTTVGTLATLSGTGGPGDPPNPPTAPARSGGLAAAPVLAAPAAEPPPPPDRAEVTGRVLDPAGRPFAGARLYVGYAARQTNPEAGVRTPEYPVRATSGPDGTFRFAFRGSELDPGQLETSRPVVMAAADGFGVDWAEVGQPPDGSTVDLKLAEDLPVEGRVRDEAGRPVAGVRVRVREVCGESAAGLTRYLRTGDHGAFRGCLGPLPGGAPEVTTGADGRFRITGIGRDRLAALDLDGPSVGRAELMVATRPAPEAANRFGVEGATFEYSSPPRRSIRGGVYDGATGRAIPGVRVTAEPGGPVAVTDRRGLYELQVSGGTTQHVVQARPDGLPYLAAGARVTARRGAESTAADIQLTAGLTVRGTVADAATGSPPARATAVYFPLYPNPFGATWTCPYCSGPVSAAAVAADGSFRLAAIPGPGVVLVAAGPADAYAAADVSEARPARTPAGDAGSVLVSVGGRKGLCRVDRYHAAAFVCPMPWLPTPVLDLKVRPASGLRGTVAGPDGRPLSGAQVTGLSPAADAETLPGPSFAVGRLGAGARELVFHHRALGLGAVVTVRGEEAGPLAVRLEPCGTVTGRLVNGSRRPVSGAVLTFRRGVAGAEVVTETGADGRFHADLVGGPEYSIHLAPYRLLKAVPPVRVEPGRPTDLGTLRVEE